MTNQKCKGTSHTKRPLVDLLSVGLAASSNVAITNHGGVRASRGAERDTYRAKQDARLGKGEFLKHGNSFLQRQEENILRPRTDSSEAGSDSHGCPRPLLLHRPRHREAPPGRGGSGVFTSPHRPGAPWPSAYVTHLSKTMPPWAHPSEVANPKGREGHGTRVTEFTLNTTSYRWARAVKNNQPFPQGNFLKTNFLKGEKLQNPCILAVGKLCVRQTETVQACTTQGATPAP